MYSSETCVDGVWSIIDSEKIPKSRSPLSQLKLTLCKVNSPKISQFVINVWGGIKVGSRNGSGLAGLSAGPSRLQERQR